MLIILNQVTSEAHKRCRKREIRKEGRIQKRDKKRNKEGGRAYHFFFYCRSEPTSEVDDSNTNNDGNSKVYNASSQGAWGISCIEWDAPW